MAMDLPGTSKPAISRVFESAPHKPVSTVLSSSSSLPSTSSLNRRSPITTGASSNTQFATQTKAGKAVKLLKEVGDENWKAMVSLVELERNKVVTALSQQSPYVVLTTSNIRDIYNVLQKLNCDDVLKAVRSSLLQKPISSQQISKQNQQIVTYLISTSKKLYQNQTTFHKVNVPLIPGDQKNQGYLDTVDVYNSFTNINKDKDTGAESVGNTDRIGQNKLLREFAIWRQAQLTRTEIQQQIEIPEKILVVNHQVLADGSEGRYTLNRGIVKSSVETALNRPFFTIAKEGIPSSFLENAEDDDICVVMHTFTLDRTDREF